MGLIKIKKGLNVPISGEPEQAISDGQAVSKVGVIGPDYIGMKPKMKVVVGDTVKKGQVLFENKKSAEIRYTAPGAGKVVAINRGQKRALLSVVIKLDGDDQVEFQSFQGKKVDELDQQAVKDLLLESGLWISFKTRPFSKTPDPNSTPHSIFVTAIDTNPLAPSMGVVLAGKEKQFELGVKVLSMLTDGTVFLCKAPGVKISGGGLDRVSVEEFSGPHPAGLVGTHINALDPVNQKKTVWTIQAQDVIAIGDLFDTGTLNVERIVSLAGPAVKNPRLVRTRMGASLSELTDGELKEGVNRIISGSVLSGFAATPELDYLGRYHQQISVVPEGGQRKFLGWLSPGFDLFSLENIVISKLFPKKKFAFTTNLNGGERPIVPIGCYEKVMPLDILATPLLRAIAISDVEEAEKLGVFELDEEDLALCTYVCPSKIDHGENLRKTLTLIEKEG